MNIFLCVLCLVSSNTIDTYAFVYACTQTLIDYFRCQVSLEPGRGSKGKAKKNFPFDPRPGSRLVPGVIHVCMCIVNEDGLSKAILIWLHAPSNCSCIPFC